MDRMSWRQAHLPLLWWAHHCMRSPWRQARQPQRHRWGRRCQSPQLCQCQQRRPQQNRGSRGPQDMQHSMLWDQVPERSLRSQSPVASMPVIAPAGKPEKGALTLSSSDIVTPSSRKRPGDNQRSAKITKKAKQGGKPAAQKSCPDCGKVQPGARQKKCSCGHDFQAVK